MLPPRELSRGIRCGTRGLHTGSGVSSDLFPGGCWAHPASTSFSLLFPCSLPGQPPQLYLHRAVPSSRFPDWPVALAALGEPPHKHEDPTCSPEHSHRLIQPSPAQPSPAGA